MHNFIVKIIAVDDKNEEFEIGKTIIIAASKKEAGIRGIKELWDPRLDAAGCSLRAEVKISAFDRFQRFVLDNYDNGEGSYITKKGDLRTYGDGLLGFLVTELSMTEGCDSSDEVLRRLDAIERQISDLRNAFINNFHNQDEEVCINEP